jgi:hypothetical protein
MLQGRTLSGWCRSVAIQRNQQICKGILAGSRCTPTSCTKPTSTSPFSTSSSLFEESDEPAKGAGEAPTTKVKIEKVASMLSSVLQEDERIRQLLLDRDGGSASVPTREGKWDQEMGRETSRHMHRVLDQTRVNKPGTSTSMGEGESKWFTNRR